MQKLLIYICLFVFGTRCAQITPLTGGKKDTTPPKVLLFVPANASLNFNSKVVEVQFDEYISVKDLANQFIITPQVKETPDIQAQGKKMRITFNETLLPNTTYKLAFGNAISDINESNVLQNFEYIFSTGPTIDSLMLRGQILEAYNKKAASQILIGLYDATATDSVIYKEKPLYISKTNENGIFKFNYLPNTPFRIVAIKDQNKNLLYDGSEEQIGFTKNLVTPSDSLNISLSLFKEMPSKTFIKKSYSPEYGKAFIIYNRPQMKIKEVLAKGLVHFKQSMSKDTLILYYINKFDTLETFIKHEDQVTDTLIIKIPSKIAFERQFKNNAIKYTIQSNFVSILPYFVLPTFELNVPVESKNISVDKITLIEKLDSVIRKPPFVLLKNENWITSFSVQAEFKPEANYTLTIQKAAITGNLNRINDSLTYRFKISTVEDYAQLKMKLLFPKKESYLVWLLNDKEQLINERVVSIPLTSTSEKIIEYNNIIPGNYFIRVIEDANKNGLFDMGDYFLNIQPETVFINSSPIKLLAGWEIENEWIVK